MPIDVNRFDSGPLAALAGRTEPRMALPLHPLLGGDLLSAQVGQQNTQQKLAADQQKADAETLKANNEMPIAQLQASTEQARTNIMQQQVNEQAKLRQMQALKMEIDARQKMSDDEMTKKQTGYSTVILGLNSVKNDTSLNDADKAAKLETVKKQTLDAAYAHGRITKDEYQQGLAMTPDQVYQHAVQEFTLNHTADQMKKKGGVGEELKNLGDTNIATSNKTQTPTEKAFTGAVAQTQAKAVQGSQQQTQALNIVSSDAKDALQILQKIPAGMTGPVVDYLKANAMDSEVQKIQKLLAGIPIAVKAMYGVTPGNRLTATELQQLNKASGSTSINKDALQWVLNRLIPQSAGIIHDNWVKENDFYKNAGGEVYKNWKESNPEPQAGFKMENGPSVGTVHVDKNGIKAKYIGGDPKDPKSYQVIP